MKRLEINWTAVTTVLTGIGVIVALLALQFSLTGNMVSLTENMGARIDIVRSDMLTLRSGVSEEIGALRSDMSEEIGALRSDMSEEIRALRSDVSEEIRVLRSDVNEEIGALREELTGEINSLRSNLREESTSSRERIKDLARATAALIMKVNSIEEKILPEGRADGDASPPEEE